MSDLTAPITIGVVGAPWSAVVNPDASIVIADSRRQATMVRFAVASTDRWHDPATEPTLRQRCVDGTPVVEHRLAVPGGDVVVTIYAVPALGGAGGVVVLAVSNDSHAPVAFGCSHPGAVGTRPAADVAVEGIDLGPGAVSFPIGHRSAIKVAITVDRVAAPAVSRLPDADRVARGWSRQCQLGARYVVPDWNDQLTRARCQLLLSAWRNADPVTGLLTVEELQQMGHATEFDERTLAASGELVSRAHRHDPFAGPALHAAARLLRRAGQRRAADDATRLALDVGGVTVTDPPDEPARFAHWVRARLLSETHQDLSLFPGWNPAWNGFGAEMHDVHTDEGVVSAVVRWHGERPALLWDYRGSPRQLRCPGLDPVWSSDQRRGEALLTPAPQATHGR
jgi:hypothetical protein